MRCRYVYLNIYLDYTAYQQHHKIQDQAAQLTAVIRKRRLYSMVWSFTTNEHGKYPQQAVQLETIPHWQKKKTWPTKDIMEKDHTGRHQQNGPGVNFRRGRGCGKGADYVEASI